LPKGEPFDGTMFNRRSIPSQFMLRQAQHERECQSQPTLARRGPFALTPSRAYLVSSSKGERIQGKILRVYQYPPSFVLQQARHERKFESGPPSAHHSPFALTPSRACRGSLSKGESHRGTVLTQHPTRPPLVLRPAQHERNREDFCRR
jgi:hypothetical protein